MRRSLTKEEVQEAARLKRVWDSKKLELQLTQAKAAKALGFTSQAAISQYLNAKVPLPATVVARFAKLLQVPVSEISVRVSDMLSGGRADLSAYTAPTIDDLKSGKVRVQPEIVSLSPGFLASLGATPDSLSWIVVADNCAVPKGSMVLVQKNFQLGNGYHVFYDDGKAAVWKVEVSDQHITIHKGSGMKLPKEATTMIKSYGKAVLVLHRLT